ncbi:MAG TPA: 3'(2'),5'-bisphosphate nucleotidase CysQ [Planctomycetia bacterium]|nr:3'(2'),5'-bisphosphate nucleotidase CysQ [Planctomycetia bacterium]
MTHTNFADELGAALDAVRAAGAEILRLGGAYENVTDAPADIVTDADLAAQAIIFRILAERFPNDAVLGEEAYKEDPSIARALRLWIVDPIDGTRGFAIGNGEYSVMVGLVAGGRPVVGVVHEPHVGRTTFAAAGQGCFVRTSAVGQPMPCSVRPTESMVDATVAMSRSRKTDSEKRLLDRFGARESLKTYSAGIKLAQVARGEADLYLGDYPAMHDWDVCAGHILVEEAGGRVTDLAGEPLVYGREPPRQSRGILATNGLLHAAALAVAKTHGADLYS